MSHTDTRPPSSPGDMHVMPTYGRDHDSSRDCWCYPEPDQLSVLAQKDGTAHGIVWVHREDN